MHPRRVASLALVGLALVAQQALAHPLSLWEIKTNSATLYLLGSIHVVKPDMYPLPEPMEEAFEQASTVVFEVDLTRVSPAHIAAVMARRGRYPASVTLASTLPPRTLEALRHWLDKLGVPYDSVSHTRPWLLSLQLEMRELRRLGYRSSLGIDEYFLHRARRSGKRIRQLETWRQQINLLADNSPSVQRAELRATIDELDDTAGDIAQLVAAWRSGDIDKLYRLSMRTADRYPSLHDWMTRLTVVRNKRMAAKIRGYLAQGGHWLVVVGALHLGGREGLIDLLGRHYRIRQITTAGARQVRPAIAGGGSQSAGCDWPVKTAFQQCTIPTHLKKQ